mgnify:CR=1 FL=1
MEKWCLPSRITWSRVKYYLLYIVSKIVHLNLVFLIANFLDRERVFQFSSFQFSSWK